MERSFHSLRTANGWSVGDAAAWFGVSIQKVEQWDAGNGKPDERYLQDLEDTLIYKKNFNRGHPMSDFTFIDLFAGIGGVRRGFEAAGGKCVFTSEWDLYAQKTYRENFPDDDHEIAGDITRIKAEDIPAHDVLLAGFPCQPFSIAGVSKKNALGRAHGFMDKAQGTLFFDVLRILKHHKPAAFMLENVKNLRSHNKGDTFKTILGALRDELGYHVQARVIDGKGYVPQHRERIFIVGFREDVGFDFEACAFPDATSGPVISTILHAPHEEPEDQFTLPPEDALSNVASVVNPKYTLSDKLWKYLFDYAAKHKAKGNGFGFGLCGPNDKARTLSARYYKDGSEILIDQGEGRNPRRLTPRECARLMGFDDDNFTMKIPVSDTRAYKQFGNSVVVPVIKEIARQMKPYVLKSLESEGQVIPGEETVAAE
ncbi:DNA (cytosine-5-)-methyltransferase [Thalassospira sp.]|uniref:DNA (cytosine-5-)-methyltransferase n=1 Tax=Thalassospira sp. TaxID=1912094 RepID=UPI0032EBF221